MVEIKNKCDYGPNESNYTSFYNIYQVLEDNSESETGARATSTLSN